MEALLKAAQQIITKTLGEEARKLLEVGGAKLDPSVLARVERSSRAVQKRRLIADTEFALLKKDLDKLAKSLAAGVMGSKARLSRGAIPSRCADVVSACQSYAVSFEQLREQTELQATLIADEVHRLSAKKANRKSKKNKNVGAASRFARARLKAVGGNTPIAPDKLTRQMAPAGSALKEMVAEQLEHGNFDLILGPFLTDFSAPCRATVPNNNNNDPHTHRASCSTKWTMLIGC